MADAAGVRAEVPVPVPAVAAIGEVGKGEGKATEVVLSFAAVSSFK